MYQLKIGQIPLPKIYICESIKEGDECRKRGIPYIIKPEGWPDDKLIKAVLWRTLNDKFPYIKWRELLGINRWDADEVTVMVPQKVKVSSDTRINPGVDTCGHSDMCMEVSDDYREVIDGLNPNDTVDWSEEVDEKYLDQYIGDLGYHVKIEELQALKLLPTFLDDITEAIKINISNTNWMDGYNKKLGCNVGHWQGQSQAPNLIVLDVSASIPSGIAGTMITLIETLKHQCNAHLIITSGRTEYWAANEKLPTPWKLTQLIGGCNECVQFYDILRTKILGRHWGNVIIFGDNDSPLRRDIQREEVELGLTTNLTPSEFQNTRIDRIMAFHTYSEKVPGYGLWAADAAPNAEIVYNTNWVGCMKP